MSQPIFLQAVAWEPMQSLPKRWQSEHLCGTIWGHTLVTAQVLVLLFQPAFVQNLRWLPTQFLPSLMQSLHDWGTTWGQMTLIRHQPNFKPPIKYLNWFGIWASIWFRIPTHFLTSFRISDTFWTQFDTVTTGDRHYCRAYSVIFIRFRLLLLINHLKWQPFHKM